MPVPTSANASPTIRSFLRLLLQKGSDVFVHEDLGVQECACLTFDGSRDEEKHQATNAAIQGAFPIPGTTLPANTYVNYIILPFFQSQHDGHMDHIGPGFQFSENQPDTFDLQIIFGPTPSPFKQGLISYDVYRSISDTDHYVKIFQITPGTTTWTDNIPVGTGTVEGTLAQVDVPECNDDGILPIIRERTVKAFVMPAYGTFRGRQYQNMIEQFGQVRVDDHLGIFPLESDNVELDLSEWTDSGSQWVELNNMRFVVISANRIPAPDNASINHHWEAILRRINRDSQT